MGSQAATNDRFSRAPHPRVRRRLVMRRVLVVALALAVSIASWANASPVDPADAWRPLYTYVGTWKGTRVGADGPLKLTRVYASVSAHSYLQIAESASDRSRTEVRGVVSLDPQRGVLVLHLFAVDGSASDLALDPAASTDGRVVLASQDSEPTRTRVTYERTGSKSFVERI